VAKSTLYRQSRFVTSVLSQDSTSFTDIITQPQKLDVLIKFIGAVTTAYINFEMIPVNEVHTFVTIYESLNDAISIESFTYHGKSLTIVGTATDRSDYFKFENALRDQAYFDSVSAHQYITTDDTIRFEIECGAAESRAVFAFN
jgi:hypothetical protein